MIYKINNDDSNIFLYIVYQNRTFKKVDSLLLDLDKEIKIKINEIEWSLVINESKGILFSNKILMEKFVEELKFLVTEKKKK